MKEVSQPDLDEYRKKNFACRTRRERWNEDGDFSLSVTHNGYQWASISLNYREAREVIKTLQKELSASRIEP